MPFRYRTVPLQVVNPQVKSIECKFRQGNSLSSDAIIRLPSHVPRPQSPVNFFTFPFQLLPYSKYPLQSNCYFFHFSPDS